MKSKATILLLALSFIHLSLWGQADHKIIKEIQELMEANYIFLDKAKETNQHLDKLIKSKYFDKFEKPEELAKALTEELQRITNDKHLHVTPPRSTNRDQESREVTFNRHLNNLVSFRDGGFGKVDFHKGNVAYFQIKGFRAEDSVKVDPLMKYIVKADAVIIDLRDNGGGNGAVGLKLSSYFLPTGIPLSSVYERRKDLMQTYNTVAVEGLQKPEVPLFILTSKKTFSAAEAFAYDLQARNRAVIIGEVTGGGAHPVNFMRLQGGFRLIVPIARSINPITKTNWEGIGVIPDSITNAEEALNVAVKMATEKAKQYREKTFTELEQVLKKKDITKTDKETVHQLLAVLLKRGHLENHMINDFGYLYLQGGYPKGALALMQTTLQLFPESPNAHDSYAEALAVNEQKSNALKHYQKAVLLATSQNDSNLKRYQENLMKFEKTLNEN